MDQLHGPKVYFQRTRSESDLTELASSTDKSHGIKRSTSESGLERASTSASRIGSRRVVVDEAFQPLLLILDLLGTGENHELMTAVNAYADQYLDIASTGYQRVVGYLTFIEHAAKFVKYKKG
ncbi:hypothetical protein GCM10023116_22970 [Kistimonas scapharcae]|uniref:Uncharacterized protein n=1 Tax=Kistimonas scapharcae TaxID=1036133 RepID=A0ABP8V367_9GAMM